MNKDQQNELLTGVISILEKFSKLSLQKNYKIKHNFFCSNSNVIKNFFIDDLNNKNTLQKNIEDKIFFVLLKQNEIFQDQTNLNDFDNFKTKEKLTDSQITNSFNNRTSKIVNENNEDIMKFLILQSYKSEKNNFMANKKNQKIFLSHINIVNSNNFPSNTNDSKLFYELLKFIDRLYSYLFKNNSNGIKYILNQSSFQKNFLQNIFENKKIDNVNLDILFSHKKKFEIDAKIYNLISLYSSLLSFCCQLLRREFYSKGNGLITIIYKKGKVIKDFFKDLSQLMCLTSSPLLCFHSIQVILDMIYYKGTISNSKTFKGILLTNS